MAATRHKKTRSTRQAGKSNAVIAALLVIVLVLAGTVWYLADQDSFLAMSDTLFGQTVNGQSGSNSAERPDGTDGTDSISQATVSGQSSFSLHMIDVGIGDSLVVVCDGHAMLIDAAENDAGDIVLAYLAKIGVTKLDVAVGTHAHSDHIGGMDTVLKTMPFDKIYLSEIAKSAIPTTKTYTDLLKVVAAKGKKITKAVAGSSFWLGEAKVTILGPTKVYDDLNNTSIVLRIDYGSTSFLLTGDMEQEAENDLLDAGYSVQADVLKVGHHGSVTATGDRFLKAVSPTYALISVNADNKYGHPHKETVAKLNKANVKTYLTRDSGSIVICSNGKKVTVKTQK